jgi:type II secretory pathway pseudopilin PulG
LDPAPRGGTAQRRARSSCAFTLTEILIVIGIIVLLLALAVPAMRVLSGGRSIEGAQNQLSAFLGRARGDAIALQETRGVMFYKNVATGAPGAADEKTYAAMVRVTDPAPPGTDPNTEVYLDLVSDVDVLTLPIGVDAQTLDNYDPTLAQGDERYIGYNHVFTDPNLPKTITGFGGVILFNSDGEIVSKTYGFRGNPDPNGTPTLIAQRLFSGLTPSTYARNAYLTIGDTQTLLTLRMHSAVGFVLFDREEFVNASVSGSSPELRDEDPMLQSQGTSNTQPEVDEEKWITEHSVPFLINRYNGTLIRGE